MSVATTLRGKKGVGLPKEKNNDKFNYNDPTPNKQNVNKLLL